MEQPIKNFTLYGSKVPIFWSKASEDRPSKELFESIDFQWEEFPNTPNFLDNFTSSVVLPSDTYTYFKLIDKQTNQITYWYIEKVNRRLNQGIMYYIALDTYTSYVIDLLDNLPETMKLGIERTHLKWEEYNKYIYPFVQDELLSGVPMGDGALFTKGVMNIENVIAPKGKSLDVSFKWKSAQGQVLKLTFRDKTHHDPQPWDNKAYPITRCYVFAAWDSDKDWNFATSPDSRYFVFPVIEFEKPQDLYRLGTLSNPEQTDINIILGNVEHNMKSLVQARANYFKGVYLLPIKQEEIIYNSAYTPINPIQHKFFYFFPLKLQGERYKQEINDFVKPIKAQDIFNKYGEIVFPSTRFTYNNQVEEWNTAEGQIPTINFYTFLNMNRDWYNNTIASNLIFKENKTANGLTISLDGYLVFSNGFRICANPYDKPIYTGGQLPSDNESYANYVNGIRETMNASLQASRTQLGLGIMKNINSLSISIAQGTMGLLDVIAGNDGSSGIFKGLHGANNALFNIFGGIANHVNTINMYNAQLTDAKNSIPPSISTTEDQDLKLYLSCKTVGEINDIDKSGAILLKRITKPIATLCDSLAFLFGVLVKNYIPWRVIKAHLENNNLQCVYLSLQKDYAQSHLFNYVIKQYPTLDTQTRALIVEALALGFRIWKIVPDLTKTYVMDLS